MSKLRLWAVCLALACTLSACATNMRTETGRPIDPAVEAKLKVGVTTIDEARQWFGEPTQVRNHSNGETGLIYVHLVSEGNVFAGGNRGTTSTLAMEFGPDGKLERFNTGGTSAVTRSSVNP